MTPTEAIYVYGVVRGGTAPDLFADVGGIDGRSPVRLVVADGTAAITSAVPLSEFDAEPLERNLKDSGWLERKVHAHNDVLAAAVGKTVVLPLRFGAIYTSEEHVREMLRASPELAQRLERLNGLLEFGVKGVLDAAALRSRLADNGVDDAADTGGRAYMLQKQRERGIAEEMRAFAAACADASHERLSQAAEDATANPAQPSDVAGREMLLNGAYLVRAGREQQLGDAVRELEERFGADGVSYELTGPWPPYNFAGEEAES